ncbi:hypothetical protein ACXITP_03640 [Actinotignum sanguinis]|uniref:Uncharacterized protein n=3 Tax=Actinomycetaceae TaxID=2049 RepID=A0ABZ0RE50_9ACTO|nr:MULTISPECIES: hypothetical protein [Actinotignum]WPJ89340.1 hypothetical protein R0V15_01735 [Schaalia turicensis]MDE1552340.1 hypothetical protein [Actinotignum sanguinis]MDE1577269.1 hypothetical protein [Actinotignum sanguinis]MDE1641846.1 hypothetical protein [Actinotignum sanguinis]MDE1653971.1 hypothetical protein [Actinotignum schaalii]
MPLVHRSEMTGLGNNDENLLIIGTYLWGRKTRCGGEGYLVARSSANTGVAGPLSQTRHPNSLSCT